MQYRNADDDDENGNGNDNGNDKEKEKEPISQRSPEELQLFEARTILISAPVDAKLAHLINTKLLAMERASSSKPIYLFINSPGGEIHSGFSIFDMARFVRPPIYTIVCGLAASMGSIIALCAPRDHRFAFANSKFLIHQPSISGGLGGSVSDIEIHARDLIETKNQIVRLYVEETKRSEADIRKALDRDYWMTAQQAADFGLIGRIVNSREEL